MLEVILSDFARPEAETSAAEEQGQMEYDWFWDDLVIDKAQKKPLKKQNDEAGPVPGCLGDRCGPGVDRMEGGP